MMLGVRDTTPSWCVMRECRLEPLKFNWFCAAMRLTTLWLNLTATQYTIKKAWHAVEYTIHVCWSAHILSAMDGLTQSYIFKQKLQNCEPIDLSRFVVDLRERHMEYWTPHPVTHPRKHSCHSKSLSLQSMSQHNNLYSLLFLKSDLLDTITYTIGTTHTLVGCRASPPQGWEVYSTIWLSSE